MRLIDMVRRCFRRNTQQRTELQAEVSRLHTLLTMSRSIFNQLLSSGMVREDARELVRHALYQTGRDAPTIRDPIMAFACQMERQMAAHDDERGDDWVGLPVPILVVRLSEELAELRQALEMRDRRASYRLVIEEAADVANFCMMIAHTTAATVVPIAPEPATADAKKRGRG